jgi:uncharacterized membrane protein
MTGSKGMRSFLLGGAALGVGAAVAWKLTSRKQHSDSHDSRNLQTIENFREHWSPTMRFAVGAVGGGLMVYGMRASGKMSRVAVTTGAGLLARSVTDKPIHDWADVLKPQSLLGI